MWQLFKGTLSDANAGQYVHIHAGGIPAGHAQV
jgi:hypothetical protein